MKGLWLSLTAILLLSICAAAGNSSDSQPSSSLLQVFVEPTDGYKPVLDALNSAQSSILVEMYLLTDKNIMRALENASSRGIKVRVMLEELAYQNPADLKAIMDAFNSSGIFVKASSPAFSLTHEKAIIVDKKIALIMTLNQDHTAYTKNREFGIIDGDPRDIAEITSTFDADWNRTVPELSDPNLVWSPVNSRERIIALLDAANRSLEVENEEMQDKVVEDHLIAAAKRGVDVKVVMSPPESMSPSKSKKDANAPGRNRISKGGVKVCLVTKPYIHAKLITADGSEAFVGSENFSPTSLDRNRELGILVNDSNIIRVLSSTFDADWNAGNQTLSNLSKQVSPVKAKYIKSGKFTKRFQGQIRKKDNCLTRAIFIF